MISSQTHATSGATRTHHSAARRAARKAMAGCALLLAGCVDPVVPDAAEEIAPAFHLVECGSIEEGDHEHEDHEHECAEELVDASYTRSKNMKFMSFSQRLAEGPSVTSVNSDLAFWGKTAYQGSYNGFRIIDISDPENITEIMNYEDCAHPGGQGDLAVWGNLLVRTWNSPASAGFTCGGQPVEPGFEGLHIFDISNPLSPQLLSEVDLTCGSHTVVLAPDAANDRLVLYSAAATTVTSCRGMHVITVPLSNPTQPVIAGHISLATPCHDGAIILGSVNRLACAGGAGFAVWSVDPADDASLIEPKLMYERTIPGVTVGHSVAFTWDGAVIVFGHEPGSGGQARCQALGAPGQTLIQKTLFFFDTESGDPVGQFVMPRDQSNIENCTWHNYNVVPVDSRYILVSGNYQSGVSVVDFTDPANAEEIAFADPAPANPTGLLVAGSWSAYWYDGLIYESDMRRGLVVWRLTDSRVAGARKLNRLNPQTQETASPLRGKK